MTSYQKLKQQNAKLVKEIELLVFKPDSLDAIMVAKKYKILRETENAIMCGNPTKSNNKFKGI